MSATLGLDPSLRALSRAGFVRLAFGTLVYTAFVILFGAIVRITGSGAGCGQHWPSCHGEIAHLPQSLETAIELTHRVTSGMVLLLVLGLAFVARRSFPADHAVRRLAVWAVVLTVFEALIGAGLVLLALVDRNVSLARALVMPAHLVNTYALMASLTAIVSFSESGPPADGTPSARARWLFSTCVTALVVVSGLGALTALGDTLYPPGARSVAAGFAEPSNDAAPLLVRLRILHPVLAVLAAGLLVHAAPRLATASRSPRARGAARAVVALVAVQLLAGIINVLLSAPGWLQLVHLGLGLGLWVSFVFLGCETKRRPA